MGCQLIQRLGSFSWHPRRLAQSHPLLPTLASGNLPRLTRWFRLRIGDCLRSQVTVVRYGYLLRKQCFTRPDRQDRETALGTNCSTTKAAAAERLLQIQINFFLI